MRLIVLLCLSIALSGCMVINGGVELSKTIWGSSTRALEEARAQAINKTCDKNYWDVLKAALDVSAKKGYEVFKKDEVRGYVVLIGIKGSVNTTEVGVFFVELGDQQTRVEVSSLSTNAKRIVSKALFHGLDIEFGLAPPDPLQPVPQEDSKDKSKP